DDGGIADWRPSGSIRFGGDGSGAQARRARQMGRGCDCSEAARSRDWQPRATPSGRRLQKEVGETKQTRGRGPHRETGIPQQAAAIAIRRTDDAFEVCLIRKNESKGWGIPKGMIELGETPEETALNEAWEEAGLKGRLLGDAVGTYEYEKWRTNFLVAVF